MPPIISVALVTRNRPESLMRCLKSLRAQSISPFEVVISDDSDAEDAAKVLALANEFDCRYTVGPRRGLYANRNRAALACRGTHIRTMDDDHEFPPGHWATVEDAVRSAAGDVWTMAETSSTRTPATLDCPSQLGPSGYGYVPEDFSNCWAVGDGCTVYPAHLFRKGILFAEEWPFGQAYLEYGARLHFKHGMRMRLVEGTYVIHHHEPGLRQEQHRLIEGASAVFAALAFSWRYQPRLAHRLATIGSLAGLILKRGMGGWHSIRWGVRAFRNRDSEPSFAGNS